MAGRKKKTIVLIPNTVNKPSGLKNDGTPNLAWKKFSIRLENFNSKELEDWKAEELLGYLLKRYKDHYEIDHTLSYSGPPSKCAEMYIIKRVMTTLGSERPQLVKKYIDWVFDTQIIPKKKELISLAYFFTVSLCNLFKTTFRNNNKPSKATLLPVNVANIASEYELPVVTYGDLAFAKMALAQDTSGDMEEFLPYRQMFDKLNRIGFDSSILLSLEDR